MANNLIITYDLHRPDQNYPRIIETIKSLGAWAHIQQSVWYIKSAYSAEQVRNALTSVTDSDDMIFVCDATQNMCSWSGVAREVSDHLIAHWER